MMASPPQRAPISVSRIVCVIASATPRSTRSPASCPRSSFTRQAVVETSLSLHFRYGELDARWLPDDSFFMMPIPQAPKPEPEPMPSPEPLPEPAPEPPPTDPIPPPIPVHRRQ